MWLQQEAGVLDIFGIIDSVVSHINAYLRIRISSKFQDLENLKHMRIVIQFHIARRTI